MLVILTGFSVNWFSLMGMNRKWWVENEHIELVFSPCCRNISLQREKCLYIIIQTGNVRSPINTYFCNSYRPPLKMNKICKSTPKVINTYKELELITHKLSTSRMFRVKRSWRDKNLETWNTYSVIQGIKLIYFAYSSTSLEYLINPNQSKSTMLNLNRDTQIKCVQG